ncbi:unnamed protein product [Rotaria magnacalcarata]|uniref:Threonyl/alanyl tRNA synthetase SAD domain-containing protein n=2 Tax=Rotaria magnacalcarata TaxID=392030 RepID=A0A819P9W2_9BILA|nr:unnamed protein product [Rotaria magnacalcarata]
MLSFIRKRFPSKDRSNEHLQNMKSHHIHHEYQSDDQLRKSQSTNDINVNSNVKKKKKKKNKKDKERCSSTVDTLNVSSSVSPMSNLINRSYSDVDYFPMMPGPLCQSMNRDKQLTSHDSSSDSYLNSSEIMKPTNVNTYMEVSQIKTQVFEIPVIDCRQDHQIPNYKDIDYQRTKALRGVTEELTKKRLCRLKIGENDSFSNWWLDKAAMTNIILSFQKRKMLKIRYCSNLASRYQSTSSALSRSHLTNDEIRAHRLRIFNNERQIQMERIRRVEKIEVDVHDPIESKKLLMNKNLSTPYHCAQHLSSILVDRSCLALIDDQHIWDMNRPLERDCTLKFLHFMEDKCEEQNRAYWRTCSFIIGYILETAFKSNYNVELCSFPPPQFQFGSFAYDAKLNLGDWKPNRDDLRCLSIQAYKLRDLDLRFECLHINESVAQEMFAYDRFKLAQIPHMLRLISPSDNQTRLTVYKMGDCHVDITRGPLVSSTKQIGRFEFSSIHNIAVPSYNEQMQRIQALSIPNQLHLHYWTFDYLLERAKKLNRASIPTLAKLKTSENKTENSQ